MTTTYPFITEAQVTLENVLTIAVIGVLLLFFYLWAYGALDRIFYNIYQWIIRRFK